MQGSDVLSSYLPTDEELANTAIVTMAAGDEAGMLAVALVQSLRDVQTRVPNVVVLLMQGGSGSAYCLLRGRGSCADSHNPADIVSPVFLRALERLEAKIEILPALPETDFTREISGGRQRGWGMAFNKLRVFGMTQYRSLLWLDADTVMLRNVDHLVVQPEFTAAFTNDCNNFNAATKISGGMWVVHPSEERMQQVMDMITTGKLGEAQEWRLGDMEVVLNLFAKFTRASRQDGFWPSSYDIRQGRVPGLELFDVRYVKGGEFASKPAGPLPLKVKQAKAAGKPYWRPLDVRYDFLVDECRHSHNGERDLGLPQDAAAELGLAPAQKGRPWGDGASLAAELPVRAARTDKRRPPWRPRVSATGYDGGVISIHFSCMRDLRKPPQYGSEQGLVDAIEDMPACVRQYYMLWYSKYLRAMQNERWFASFEMKETKQPPALEKIDLVD